MLWPSQKMLSAASTLREISIHVYHLLHLLWSLLWCASWFVTASARSTSATTAFRSDSGYENYASIANFLLLNLRQRRL